MLILERIVSTNSPTKFIEAMKEGRAISPALLHPRPLKLTGNPACFHTSFWKEIRSRTVTSQKVSGVVDGRDTDTGIANVFYEKFSSISGKCVSSPNSLRPINNHRTFSNLSNRVNRKELFSLSQITEAIKLINTGIGIDGVHSNHLKYLPTNCIRLLVKFFNACIIHNHIPAAMLEGYIKPSIKDKTGDIQTSDNYREVMISNNLFKVLEYALLPLLRRCVNLSPFQFAYRNSTSTIMAAALVKETVTRYISEGSTVYAGFVDLSKAFERVPHDKLLLKLKKKDVPDFIVNMLSVMFMNSSVSVKYGNDFSRKWKLLRGVRQGGVLSAYLFCIYLDDILENIGNLGIGCKLGINYMNVQAYADDIVLLAPTASGLRTLLENASSLITDSDLVLNTRKTKTMVFRPKNLRTNDHPTFSVFNDPIEVVDSFKYLGCTLSSKFNDCLDIDRCCKAFNKSAGFLLRKFYYTDPNVQFFLFNSYCTSFYGCELWTWKKNCSFILKELSVCYHAVLKKILKIPKYSSNHFTCLTLNTLCFDHLLNFRQARFLHWLKNTKSPCFYRHRFYFLENSFYKEHVCKLWRLKYDVENVLQNDVDALLSRILYVQRREPSSMFVI